MSGPGDSGDASGGIASGGIASGGVIAGFFAFTEITEPSAHKAYNEWHQFDHLPEQLPIAGIASGQRWVASPECRAVTFSSGEDAGDKDSGDAGSGDGDSGDGDSGGRADLSVAQYLTLYLMRGPLDDTLRAFYDLAVRLHEEDRFFPHRRALESGPLGVHGLFAAPRVRVSPAAIPYRPNRGVYAVVKSPGTDRSEASSGSLDAAAASELLQIDGVAGVWFFGPGRETNSGVESESSETTAPAGSGSTFNAEVTLCFLDEDPVSVADAITSLLRPRWERDGRMPRLAGPYETVVPRHWDWFDDPR